MKQLRWIVPALVALALAAPAAQQKSSYFPGKGKWDKRAPATLGLDAAKLDEAIAFSVANQNTGNKDLTVDIPNQFRNEAPYNNLIGPAQERTGMNGIVIRHGYVAAEWGDTARADMTFSVTKTFLSTVVGVAYDQGLIKDVTHRVDTYLGDEVELFRTPHNAKITWEHLLRQTSDWSGTLWDKPDWADRPVGATPAEWEKREMHEPGTYYKYNDTRINVLALAALHVLRKPLPEVLKEEIMDPIGASNTWHWEAYDNAVAHVEMEPKRLGILTVQGAKKMKSVTGGGHFGGGMFISATDMARFGYLFLNNGKWGKKQLISEKWIGMAKTPGPANTQYGYCNWFLNTPNPTTNGRPARQMYPAAPASAVAFRGNGENIIYIDYENDMVVVVRWARNVGGFIEKVLAAIQK